METNLFLISGGGFSTEENSYIDTLALKTCTEKVNKKIVFIPTASHDAKEYIDKFHLAFNQYDTYHLTRDELTNTQLINDADLIYIGGGDTHYLMSTLLKTGFDKKLIDAYLSGITIAGISAGACCWFDTICQNGQIFNGLGIIKGSFCPHYDIEDEYKYSYDNWAKNGPDITHYRLNNNESFHVHNSKIIAKITSFTK